MSSRVERPSVGDVPRSLAGREGRRRRDAVRRAVVLLVGLACGLSWCSAPSVPSGGYARKEEGTRPDGRSSGLAPRVGTTLASGPQTSALLALRRLAGFRLKFCPQGQLAINGTPLKTQSPLTRRSETSLGAPENIPACSSSWLSPPMRHEVHAPRPLLVRCGHAPAQPETPARRAEEQRAPIRAATVARRPERSRAGSAPARSLSAGCDHAERQER